MRLRLALLLLLHALVWGQTPVRVLTRTLPVEGKMLRYALLFPPVPFGKRVPLLVSLHFGGQVRPDAGLTMAEQLVQPALGPLGAVIAAPDCPGQGWTDPTSVAAVLALVAHLKATEPVDPCRIAVVGFSMGAIGTWHLAGRGDSLFKAGVALAGLPTQAPTSLAFPIHAVFSREDRLFSESRFQPFLERLQAAHLPVTHTILDGCSHYDTRCWQPALRRTLPWLEKQLSRPQ